MCVFPIIQQVDRYAPKEICDAIYGGVAGAYFDSTIGYWRVPCLAEIDMALQIGFVLPRSQSNLFVESF